MKLSTTATLLGMLMAVVPHQTQALRCSNVCPNEDSRGCWAYFGVSNRMCQAGGPLNGCSAWCYCDIFGGNCAPCGTCSRSAFDADVAAVALPVQEEDAYEEWMAMTDNEKEEYVSTEVCGNLGKGKADGLLHQALEELADTNHDGFLSRIEYENAHYDTTAITDEHCIKLTKGLRGKKETKEGAPFQPDEELIEEVEAKEITVLQNARENLFDIVDEAFPGTLEDPDTNSSVTLMQQRKLTKCSVACEACKTVCDAKLLLKESACVLACGVFPQLSCTNACRLPRQGCHQACTVV